MRLQGSPPLTRGQLPHGCGHCLDRGITPAHAGTTFSRLHSELVNQDHPRSRGDNVKTRDDPSENPGSPPLTRGQQRIRHSEAVCEGITPAHAGTTINPVGFFLRLGDHPRSRGDNRTYTTITKSSWGSPPLTRGQPIQVYTIAVSRGITPAHAGTTCPPMSACRRSRDHPRSRGDNVKSINRHIQS